MLLKYLVERERRKKCSICQRQYNQSGTFRVRHGGYQRKMRIEARGSTSKERDC